MWLTLFLLCLWLFADRKEILFKTYFFLGVQIDFKLCEPKVALIHIHALLLTRQEWRLLYRQNHLWFAFLKHLLIYIKLATKHPDCFHKEHPSLPSSPKALLSESQVDEMSRCSTEMSRGTRLRWLLWSSLLNGFVLTDFSASFWAANYVCIMQENTENMPESTSALCMVCKFRKVTSMQ